MRGTVVSSPSVFHMTHSSLVLTWNMVSLISKESKLLGKVFSFIGKVSKLTRNMSEECVGGKC